MKRKDPFRTLDDPEPEPRPAPEPAPEPAPAPEPTPAKLVMVDSTAPRSLGYWQMWPAVRPSRLRRLLVRLILGWKWHE